MIFKRNLRELNSWTVELLPVFLSFVSHKSTNNFHIRSMPMYQEGTGKSGSYGMWNHPRGHVWNVFVRPASS